jgi:hypothetical protein
MRLNISYCIEDGDFNFARVVVDGTDESVGIIPVDLSDELQRDLMSLRPFKLNSELIKEWECDGIPDEVREEVDRLILEFPSIVSEEIERSFQSDYFAGLAWLEDIGTHLAAQDTWHPMARAVDGEVPLRCRSVLYAAAEQIHRIDRESGYHMGKILDSIEFSVDLVGMDDDE